MKRKFDIEKQPRPTTKGVKRTNIQGGRINAGRSVCGLNPGQKRRRRENGSKERTFPRSPTGLGETPCKE